MKKLSYILLLAVVAFTACRKHDDTLQNPQEEAWVSDLTLPVPIQFSGNGVLTKALVESLGDMEGTLGIVAVDTTVARWDRTVSGSILFTANEEIWGVAKAAVDSDGNIGFDDGTGSRYYPMYSENNYTFYGYYPYDESVFSQISTTPPVGSSSDKGFRVRYKIGNVDILWGKAAAEDYTPSGSSTTYKGYNARYIRKVREDKVYEAKMPKMHFKHLLTALDFYLVSENATAQTVEITGIKILNTYQYASLLVAKRRQSATDPEPTYMSGTFLQEDFDNDLAYPKDRIGVNLTVSEGITAGKHGGYIATKEGLSMGTALLVPTPTPYSNEDLNAVDDESTFYIEVSAKTSADNYTSTIKSIFKLTAPNEGFLAGTRYKYNITVKDLEKLDIKVSLAGWNLYDGPGGDSTAGEVTFGGDED